MQRRPAVLVRRIDLGPGRDRRRRPPPRRPPPPRSSAPTSRPPARSPPPPPPLSPCRPWPDLSTAQVRRKGTRPCPCSPSRTRRPPAPAPTGSSFPPHQKPPTVPSPVPDDTSPPSRYPLPMNTQARPARPATYQDILDAPPHMVAEIASGRLHLHPRPAMRHSRASFRMAGRLDGMSQGGDGPGGWHLTIEPELHLGPDVLVPDLAGWRRERLPVFPDAPFIDLAPDWVCENPLPRHPPLRPHREARPLRRERRRPPLARRPRRPHPRSLHPPRRRLDPRRRLPGRRRHPRRPVRGAGVSAGRAVAGLTPALFRPIWRKRVNLRQRKSDSRQQTHPLTECQFGNEEGDAWKWRCRIRVTNEPARSPSDVPGCDAVKRENRAEPSLSRLCTHPNAIRSSEFDGLDTTVTMRPKNHLWGTKQERQLHHPRQTSVQGR